MTNETKQTVRTVSTFAFLGTAVVLAGASLCSWGGLFAAPVALQGSDDPLANRLQIVEPTTRARADAQPATAGESAALLQNWVYTDDNTSQNR